MVLVDRPRLVLVDTNPSMTGAWGEEFAPWPDEIDVVTGPIERIVPRVDGVITAGNCYGEMNGGVDLALARALPGVQRRVWQCQAERHLGYQPVGTAEVVATGDPHCRWLVYAPTMRVPMPLTGGLEIAVHDALWAALVAITRHNDRVGAAERIRVVACTGFGSGYGSVPPSRSAQLMAAAYECWRASGRISNAQREDMLS